MKQGQKQNRVERKKCVCMLTIVLVGFGEVLGEGLAVGFEYVSIGDDASNTSFFSVLQTLFTWQLFPGKK
jgi:hypothetical protein